jgi:ankyrin repeat protein
LLINSGANVNAKAGDGRIPLDTAMERRNLPVLIVLGQHGAKPGH